MRNTRLVPLMAVSFTAACSMDIDLGGGVWGVGYGGLGPIEFPPGIAASPAGWHYLKGDTVTAFIVGSTSGGAWQLTDDVFRFIDADSTGLATPPRDTVRLVAVKGGTATLSNARVTQPGHVTRISAHDSSEVDTLIIISPIAGIQRVGDVRAAAAELRARGYYLPAKLVWFSTDTTVAAVTRSAGRSPDEPATAVRMRASGTAFVGTSFGRFRDSVKIVVSR